MSTLPPTPSYNPHIPIITSEGGSPAAYKDPNSPESLMKKTTLLKAQTAVDTTYDVDLNTVSEPFRGRGGIKPFKINNSYASYYLFVILVALLYFKKSLGKFVKISYSYLRRIFQNGARRISSST
jgi:hypothetical protein